jgi:hypothetical protein
MWKSPSGETLDQLYSRVQADANKKAGEDT